MEPNLAAAIGAVVEFVEADPEGMRFVEAVLESQLRPPIGAETYGLLLESLGWSLGASLAEQILTVLVRLVNDADELSRAAAGMPDSVLAQLRSTCALYGVALREASTLAWQDPNDWRVIRRNTTYNPELNRWRIELEIVKYGGDVIVFQQEPGSLVSMAYAILDTLTNIPDDQTPDLVDDYRLQQLADVYARFSELYRVPRLLASVPAPDEPALPPPSGAPAG